MSNACFAGQWLFRCLSFQSHSNRGVDTCAVSLPFVCRRSVTTWESATFTWSSSVRYRVGMAVAVGRRLGSPLRGHLLQGRHRSWCRVLEKCLWGFWQQKLKVPDIYPHIYSHFSSICFFSVFFFSFSFLILARKWRTLEILWGNGSRVASLPSSLPSSVSFSSIETNVQ